jgi:hypothetical protein
MSDDPIFEDLLQGRCRHEPRWASEEIIRLRDAERLALKLADQIDLMAEEWKLLKIAISQFQR